MSKSTDDLYPNSRFSPELSLRDEFIATFDGTSQEIPKARPCLLRIMRRTATGNKIACECTDPLTREPDKDRLCAICLGEGFKWDEHFEEMYKVHISTKEVLPSPGLINTSQMVFYMRYNADLTNDDKIVEIVLDREGQPVKPYKRTMVYRMQEISDLRLDNGRIEYLKIITYAENVKHLNV